jgi:hypothetical protein
MNERTFSWKVQCHVTNSALHEGAERDERDRR